MNFWVSTDTHLGHNMLHEESHGGRPKGYEERILNNIKFVIHPEDVFIHLGDVAFYQDSYWHERLMSVLPCRRWLILGNHDKKSLTWYLTHGWHSVSTRLELVVYGKRVLLSHKPVEAHEDFDLNIHGHLHCSHRYPELERTEKHILVVSEGDFKPIKLRTLVEGSCVKKNN